MCCKRLSIGEAPLAIVHWRPWSSVADYILSSEVEFESATAASKRLGHGAPSRLRFTPAHEVIIPTIFDNDDDVNIAKMIKSKITKILKKKENIEMSD